MNAPSTAIEQRCTMDVVLELIAEWTMRRLGQPSPRMCSSLTIALRNHGVQLFVTSGGRS